MSPNELRAVQAELEKRASEQEADKLEAEAEANDAQAEADRQKADAARMKESALSEAQALLKQAEGLKTAKINTKQALDRGEGKEKYWVSGLAGGMTLQWGVWVWAKNQREADKEAETLVWSASPTVEWEDGRGRPLSREVIPTKAQLNHMSITAG